MFVQIDLCIIFVELDRVWGLNPNDMMSIPIATNLISNLFNFLRFLNIYFLIE